MEKIKLIKQMIISKEGKEKMNTGSVKNIVILKDLPSNLVEEAIVFLKENQKLKKPELIDVDLKPKSGKITNKEMKQTSKDYIINEAQMLISDYISKLESKNRREDVSYKKLKKKYEFLKKVSAVLAIGFIASISLLFII